jgi:hypothetical protein
MSTTNTMDRSDLIAAVVDDLEEALTDATDLTDQDRVNLTKIRKLLGHALSAASPALDFAAPAPGAMVGLSSSERGILAEIDASRAFTNPGAVGDARVVPWRVNPNDTKPNGIVAKAKLNQHDAAGHWQFTAVATVFATRKRHLAHGMRRLNRGLLFVPDARPEDVA